MKYSRALTMAVAVTALSVAAITHAQVMDRKGLTLEGAKKVIAAAMAEARNKNAPGGVIAVVDDGGNLMALERMDNTFAAGANISIGKARTSALFKKPTKVFEDIVNKGRTTMVALNDFTPLQGGVPIEFEGKVVGAVGVSGAASAQQDEEIAIAGANALKHPLLSLPLEPREGAPPTGKEEVLPSSGRVGEMPPGVGGWNNSEQTSHVMTNGVLPVTYIESRTVAAAFNKGAVLVGEDEHMMYTARNYMVHASHRDAAGMVEIHELDTDIVYVLKGTATLVTGGTPVDTKTIAAHEIRGASVQNGQTRHLMPGDVIIIPNGVPHWFQEVSAPFDYYVVKVR
ncbi:MAG: heme-binding protein [Nitrospiraceae bacterium]